MAKQKRVKLSLYRLPECLNNRHIKVARWSTLCTGSLYLPPRKDPGVDPQGHSAGGRINSIKIPLTPSGIKPATFRPAAQSLNQLRQHVPLMDVMTQHQQKFVIAQICKQPCATPHTALSVCLSVLCKFYMQPRNKLQTDSEKKV